MSGTFVFIHGTGRPDSSGDRQRIRAALDAQPWFADWELVCPPWGERVAGTWGNPLDALPPEQRTAIEPDGADAASFDAVVQALGAELAAELAAPTRPTTAGGVRAEAAIPDFVLAAVTSAIAAHRARVTVAVGDFVRNVFVYFHRRDDIRDWIVEEVARVRAQMGGPLVVAGHSIGGVIAVDALTHRPQPRTLLVTAGSQMPLFATLRLSDPIGSGGIRPFAPWLNVYNPRDPVAFYASTVFPPEPVFPPGTGPSVTSPTDVELTHPKHLPEVHTAYFEEPALYERIRARLEAGDFA